MNYERTGGPAFPCVIEEVQYEGATLRDYFAAKAMQGALSNSYVAERYQMKTWEIAKEAYELADAMLAEREASQ